MTGLALYRLPHEQQVTMVAQTEGEPQEFLSCEALNGQTGFVVAPFSISPDTPLILIRPDVVKTFKTVSDCFAGRNSLFPLEKQFVSIGETTCFDRGNTLRKCYASDFSRFFEHLRNGNFRKLVLSRCAEEPAIEGVTPMELFQRACQLYPRLFISLVYTPKSGLWLTATPEILLEGDGSEWRTIALAGTMKLEGDELLGEGEHMTWSTKNIQEQRIVATYITECLELFTGDFREEGPRTVRAANLVHLRSDFTFKLADNNKIGDLLQALHPTPAVCGLPKREAFKFIVKNEHTPRRYYSGFMGPVAQENTHLYVSLRCMNIDGDVCHLYAGGGLLKDSVEEQEWLETEAKMETMKKLLYVQQ